MISSSRFTGTLRLLHLDSAGLMLINLVMVGYGGLEGGHLLAQLQETTFNGGHKIIVDTSFGDLNFSVYSPIGMLKQQVDLFFMSVISV